MDSIEFEESIEAEELEQEAPEIIFQDEPIECTKWAVPHFGTMKLSQQILIQSNAIWKFWDSHYEISDISNELRIVIRSYADKEYGVEYGDSKIDAYLARHGKMIFSPILLVE